jgi:DNA polymerase/3'-5' exonuclease PolX
MIPLEQARQVGLTIISGLREGCEAIVLAGSIRRECARVDDVDIVHIPMIETVQVDMFTSMPIPTTNRLLEAIITAGVLRWDSEVKRNGPKLKRLVHVASNLVVELYTATPENWGLILALRTGPGDFNKVLVSHEWEGGGAMPVGMVMRGGQLFRQGQVVPTPTEEIFFREIGVPCWPPQERTATRLRQWLKSRRSKREKL